VLDQGFGPRLERSLETVVYRVAQEAINNIARHSGATQARVHLQSNGNSVSLAVEDNGHGFDQALTSVNQGLGLQGMRERMSMAGGKVAIESQSGRGTTVRLEIPLG
jgi:signal transduction histidine kinase